MKKHLLLVLLVFGWVSSFAQPANDNCAGATSLGTLPTPAACPSGIGAAVTTTGTTIAATGANPYTTLLGCQTGGNQPGPAIDVWYSFVATGNLIQINITPGSVPFLANPAVTLWTGNCAGLVGMNCANNGTAAGNLSATFAPTTPGVTYYLEVSGMNSVSTGNFNLSVNNNNDCNNCNLVSNLTATPAPVNGTYGPGQTVTFCYTISSYAQVSSNWLHGVVPTFGCGWNLASLVPGNPNEISASGTWGWYNSCTSSANGSTTGPGFYFNYTTPADVNPGNNFGDYNPGSLPWTFCWTITTSASCACTNLNISINTLGDGESGSWTSIACLADPNYTFGASMNCCSITAVGTNNTCFGGNTGTATATQGSGTGPFTYVWSPAPGGGQGTLNATGLTAGTYTITSTDNVGCVCTATVAITQPTVITATQSQVNVTCNGSCNGTASVVAAGGNGTYTYNWTPAPGGGQGTANATGLCAGTYTCTISSPAGCSITKTFSITQPPVITATQSQVNLLCNGVCNGTASVIAAGGTGTYTYNWTPAPGGGQGTPNATGLCAGTYTCTISSPAGCSITKSFTITQPAALTGTSSSTPANCGSGTGTVTANGVGGTGPYSYSWNTIPVQNTQTAINLSAGSYTCTITDANGCTTTTVATVTSTGSITATITSTTNVICFGGSTGSATAAPVGGAGPYVYAWNSTPSQATATATGLPAGSYTCTVTDAGGCTATASVTITQNPVITATSSQTNLSCNGVCNGTATVVPAGGTGTYTYNWTPSGGSAATASGLCASNYTCTISSPAGCTLTQTFTITQPSVVSVTPSQTNVACNGACTGIATCVVGGGVPSYTYAWSPTGGTGNSAPSLCSGTYTCTVTDANGCVTTQTFTITQPTAISATTSFVSATCGNSNGSATATGAGGVGPYSYSWNSTPVQNTQTATGIPQGTYTCTITDANLCTFTVSVTVPNAGSPTATLSTFTNVTCFGACDGTATVTAASGTGPYTYSWNTVPVQLTATATGLCPGTYTATVTDANACSATTTVTITEPTAITLSGTQVDVNCNAACNGSATVTAGGGTPPYSYSWTSGGIGSTETSLCAGSYTCTVTDANGCTSTQTFTITEPPALTLSAAGFNVTCNGVCDGQIVVIPAGGTPTYSFSWNNGCTNASCNGICAGSYTITVTDLNGCTVTGTATVTQPTALVVSTTEVDAHCNQADGSVTASAVGGTGVPVFQWIGGPATATWNGVAPGTYSVIVTDANGCDDTVSVTVNNIPGITASLVSVANVSCNGVCDGAITCNSVGGTGSPTYAWLPSGGTGLTASNLCAGTYTFTVTDAAGCSDTSIATVTQPSVLSVTASANPTAVCAGQNVTLTGNGLGGTPTYTYSWVPFGNATSSATVTPAGTGPATFIVTDANGCMDSAIVNITVNPNPVAILSGDSLSGCAPLCVNFSDLSTLASGSITGWLWDFGDGNTSTQQNPQHCYSAAGPYNVTLTVTTASGCTNTIIMPNYINVFSNPVADFTAGPQPTTELDPTIYFTDASTNASAWLWSFGDTTNASSTLQNPFFTYAGPGCFNVVLTVSTSNGCIDTAVHMICIDPDVTLFVPNAFTPNDDGKNEIFKPQGIGIDPEKFEMWIFDRWGNMIFYTDDFNKGWDGKVQGHSDLCQIDTYVWKIKAYDVNGGKHNLIGKVSLVR